MYYVYLLLLSNNKYYVGSTKDLKSRLNKHQSGDAIFTSKHRPFKLVWYSAFQSKKKAIDFERYLKSSSGKAFRNKRFI